MKKIILMAILALSLLSVGDVVQAATPDASSGATVAVSDTNGVIWTSENKVPIFSDSVFYPGYDDEYWFTVKNTNSHAIEYRMVFDLKDQSGVPLDIKVSRDNRTIFEHQTANHATEETVESENLKLPAGASFSYRFKITWHDNALTDAEDTAHGLAAMTENKTTSVNFYFEKPNNGGNIPGDTDETIDGSTTPIGLLTTGNTQPIGQKLADTFGKLGEENATLVSSLGVATIVIIGILVLKRRRADEKN